MFTSISMNWRGRPLISYRTIIELISARTTAKGLTIRAEEDLNHYETGTKVSNIEFPSVPLMRHKFHRDWNYTIAQSESRWALSGVFGGQLHGTRLFSVTQVRPGRYCLRWLERPADRSPAVLLP
jgi:hypothetical protein